MFKRTVLFLILNFSALAIGSLFTNSGVSSEWYQNLSKAPWTPPGWVFGVAWSSIMFFFAIYMAYLIKLKPKKTIIIFYSIQWVLNIVWNPVFFYFQEITLGLICISLLTAHIILLFFKYLKEQRIKTLLLAPYGIWLIIATSLNAYIYLYN
ncbi:MAG: Tryptophan-rich sensory protein [Flavobacteriaceae bacterium]|nr:MAG: Tryptophan-rich sensory protein [Flavobacteriaceae bacterium]|tara:strand:- start:3927 stop:4382 length:456 start_codon:yes stop_codon:yes gene_type:complete